MELLCTWDRSWRNQCQATLFSQRIDHRWLRDERGAVILDVPVSSAMDAFALLSEQWRENYENIPEPLPPPRKIPWYLRAESAFWVSFSASLVLLFFFTVSHPVGMVIRSRGVLNYHAFAQGDWWRLVTAAFLHADFAHVLGNAVLGGVLGWAASERVGWAAAWVGWLASAVVGFWVGIGFASGGGTLGASGGVFGLLGMTAVSRTVGERGFKRRRGLRIVAAAVMLLAFTAFSRESNVAAHLGGFVAGGVMGWLVERKYLTVYFWWRTAAVGAVICILSFMAALFR